MVFVISCLYSAVSLIVVIKKIKNFIGIIIIKFKAWSR